MLPFRKRKEKNCKYEISDIGLQRDLSSEQILIILASGEKKFTMKIRISCYISVKPHETTAVYTVKTSLYYLNVALPFLIIRAANNISLPQPRRQPSFSVLTELVSKH